jgi:hypothetical protein
MIATALIDSRIQFEIDLIEPVYEANPKVLSIGFPDQALRNSFRQPKPEQASILAAGSVVEPIVRQPKILRNDKGRIDQRLGEGSGIEQHLAVIHQRNDIHIRCGSGDQPRRVQRRAYAHDQVVSRRSVQGQSSVQEMRCFLKVAGELYVI